MTLLVAAALLAGACSDDGDSLTVYSGRSEELVAPLIERFRGESDIDVEVRYAGSSELAGTIVEEGANSPADVFFAQDPASLGRVALTGLFAPLPEDLRALAPAEFSDPSGRWVGVSGRVRVLVYDRTDVAQSELPASVQDLTQPQWNGRLGVAPTNGSFLAFVAAMILLDGEDATRAWLEALAGNGPVDYPGNSPIVAAVDAGEIDAGLVNHYYLLRLIDEQGSSEAANHFLPAGDAGSLVMPAGAGIVASGDNAGAAAEFIRFLLSEQAQRFFAEETFEYPLAAGVTADPALPPLTDLNAPELDLSRLAETLDRATELVTEAGLV